MLYQLSYLPETAIAGGPGALGVPVVRVHRVADRSAPSTCTGDLSVARGRGLSGSRVMALWGSVPGREGSYRWSRWNLWRGRLHRDLRVRGRACVGGVEGMNAGWNRLGMGGR